MTGHRSSQLRTERPYMDLARKLLKTESGQPETGLQKKENWPSLQDEENRPVHAVSMSHQNTCCSNFSTPAMPPKQMAMHSSRCCAAATHSSAKASTFSPSSLQHAQLKPANLSL